MGAVAHYLEARGVPTTSISLVRENTVLIRPPRALWVPFPLGRPFGAPHAPDFQRRVLRAALALVEREDGPVVLADFPDDAPAETVGEDDGAAICPVSFPPAPETTASGQGRRVLEEMRLLGPWYDLAHQRNGRTSVGVAGMDPTAAARFLDDLATTGTATPPPGRDLAAAIYFAAQDLRDWHLEAVAARPGGPPSARALAEWFWGETAAGALLLALHPVCLASPDARVRHVGTSQLIPRAERHRL